MTRKIGFVRSRKPYPSYDDFWKLVELSAFEWAWADVADLAESSRLWVWPTMNMEFLGRVLTQGKSRKARVAWWYLERPDANLPEGADAVSAFKAAVDQGLESVDAVWVSDRALARISPNAVLAPFGSHEGLRELPPLEARYDVFFVGQRTPRRRAVIEAIEAKGLSVSPDSSGFERETALASSKISLVVGRTGRMQVVTPLRWALAAAYDLPILQEDLPDPWPLSLGTSIAMAPVAGLPEAAFGLAWSESRWDLARAAHDLLLREITFRVGVERAASQTP